jgi:hypothetical protein
VTSEPAPDVVGIAMTGETEDRHRHSRDRAAALDQVVADIKNVLRDGFE